MTREEILTKLQTLLQGHKTGARGSIHQDPYKSDFFELFAAAFNCGFLEQGTHGYLGADALGDTLSSRAPELANHAVWHDLQRSWLEWTYAWRHVKQLELKS